MTGTKVERGDENVLAASVVSTSITTPLVIGGTATTSDLVLQTTSGVGASGSDMIFKVGNNGALTVATFNYDGTATFGTGSGSIATTLRAGSGELDITGGGLVDINAGANLDIDVTGTVDILASTTFSIDGTGASNVTATSGNLTVSTATTGTLILTSVALIDMNAGANLDIDVTGTYDMLSTGVFSIDGTGASNVSATSGNLTLSTITSGTLVLDAVATLDMNAVAATLDASGGYSIDGTGAACNVSATSQDLTVSTITGGTLAVTSAAALDLNGVATTIDASGGFSIDGTGAASNVSSTSQDLTVSTITSGTLFVTAGALLDIDAAANIDIDVTGTFDVLATTTFSIDGTGASNVSATSGDLTLSTIAAGDLILTSASGEITANDLIKPNACAGADCTTALLIGVGTTGDPALTAAPNVNFMEVRGKTTATSGANHGFYFGLEGNGTGAYPIPFRGRAYLTGACANAHGGAFTLEDDATNGAVTGLGTGCRMNWVLGNAAQEAGGTYYGAMAEIYCNGNASDPSPVARYACLAIGANGDATGAARVKNAIDFHSTGADASGNMIYTHAHAEGNAAGSIRVLINGVAKYLKFWDAE